MKRIILGLLVGAAWFFLGVGAADAGWRYSSFAQPGYSYYPAGNYAGYGWSQGGYYRYEEKPAVVIAAFVQPVYVPVAFSTYQPASVSVYQTQPLATVAPLQEVRPPAAAVGVAPVHPCAALEARVKALEALLAASPPLATPRSAPPPSTEPAAPKPPDGHTVLVNRCAKCHNEAKAGEALPSGKLRGGGHVFFRAGKLVELKPAQLTGFYQQITGGDMPPDGKLEEAEGQAILAYLKSLKAKG